MDFSKYKKVKNFNDATSNLYVGFREPLDYTAKSPEVLVDGQSYRLYDKGYLRLNATPKVLAEVILRLRRDAKKEAEVTKVH